jgi:hypothetical protein
MLRAPQKNEKASPMDAPEMWFAFAVVPAYLVACLAFARVSRVRRLGGAGLLALYWAFGALLFGTYSALSGLASGNWLGVAIFSGSLGAALATALAVTLRPAVKVSGRDS